MIRGHFIFVAGGRPLPIVDAVLHFSTINRRMEVPLLVDTGADRTILSHFDAIRLMAEVGVDLASLPRGEPLFGVGGRAENRVTEAVIEMGAFSMSFTLSILEPSAPLLPIPSVLGRDVLSHFALFMEERTSRVFLLEPQEADALNLPSWEGRGFGLFSFGAPCI